MLPLQITRRVTTEIDPKQLLRRQVEQMPLEMQYAFVEAALELIDERSRAPQAAALREPQLLH